MITVSANNELYHPIKAMTIAAISLFIVYLLHFWGERKFKIDDAVAAVAVHGYAGFFSRLIRGLYSCARRLLRMQNMLRSSPSVSFSVP